MQPSFVVAARGRAAWQPNFPLNGVGNILAISTCQEASEHISIIAIVGVQPSVA